MCIWIDSNMYTENCDDIKLYEYLYHIINMFARKNSYFHNECYYDDFALSSASRLFMRIKDQRLAKIKSILNYIKTIIYPYKVDFEKENYVENPQEVDLMYSQEYCLGTNLIDEVDLFDKIEFNYTLDNITTIIHSYLSKIHVHVNSPEWINIYISCSLTLISAITTNTNELSLKKNDLTDKDLKNIYLESEKQPPILYHLDKSYGPYIKVLVNEIKAVIAKNLAIENRNQISTEDAIKSIIVNSLDLED